MEKSKSTFYIIFSLVLTAVLVFTGIATYKFASALSYRKTSDKIYTFSEITGFTEDDNLTRADYYFYDPEEDMPVGGTWVNFVTKPEDLSVVKTKILKSKFVETHEKIDDEMKTIVLTLDDGKVINIYTSGHSFSFSTQVGKYYRAIGATYLHDIGYI